MTKKTRKILHVDLDAFFASVEELDHPEYKTLPLAVGGSRERGILSTCNYEARKFGLHSAMPVYLALQRCPNLVLLPVRHERYEEMSRRVSAILKTYTRIWEPVSIDEAYLDISAHPEPARLIAEDIQKEVLEVTGLSLSVGISYNKFFAKLASEWKKPHGVFEITPQDIPEILYPLSVEAVHGIGKMAAKKLKSLGISTVQDLYQLEEKNLIHLLGQQGKEIYDFIRGKDQRPVSRFHERKSIGRERTFSKNKTDLLDIKKALSSFCDELSCDLKAKNLQAKTIHLKIKTASFQTITRSHSFSDYIDSAEDIRIAVYFLLEEISLQEPVRLLGISASHLRDTAIQQLRFL